MNPPFFPPTSTANNTHTITDDSTTFKEGIVWTRGDTVIMFGLSLCSILLPLSALLSILLFRNERNKSSMRILVYKFIADVLTSCGSLVGMPFSGSQACWFEGIVTNIFTLSSILWTGVIMLILYSVLAFKEPLGDHWAFHMVCWGFPIIVTVIPLSTSTYGSPGGIGWCWIVIKDDDPPVWEPDLWYWLSFYLYVWVTMILITILSLRILLHMGSPDMRENTRTQFFQIFYKLLGYPVIIFICWLPSTILNYIQHVNADTKSYTAVVSLHCMMGLLSGLYFWLVNRSMHQNWKQLYSVRFNLREYDAQFSITTGTTTGRTRSMSDSASIGIQITNPLNLLGPLTSYSAHEHRLSSSVSHAPRVPVLVPSIFSANLSSLTIESTSMPIKDDDDRLSILTPSMKQYESVPRRKPTVESKAPP